MSLEYKNPISWTNLSRAIIAYESLGYKYIEVPWLVPRNIMQITCEKEYSLNENKFGDFVGSGEQSFLHLQFDDNLAPGRYMTITPCLREEEETEFNKRQFIKLELYVTDDTSIENLMKVIKDCQTEFVLLMNFREEIVIKEIGDGTFDLCCKDIELGSYGIREHNGHKWIYATGLAEPRFSQVKRI